MRFSLIGGTGALGVLLRDHLVSRGDDVSLWGRSGPGALDVTAPEVRTEPVETDCVVYLAWATTDRSTAAQDAHVAAAERWARAAALAGSRFLFVSTVLASSSARSEYGRGKFRAEERLVEHGAVSLRVGLVVDDGHPDLLATRLRRVVARAPALRRAAWWPTYPVSGADVAAACRAEAIAGGSSSAVAWVAPDDAVPLAEVLLPGSSTPPSPALGRAVDLAARLLPPVPGPIGRYGDALRGLTPVPRDPTTRAPANGPIAASGWLEGTRLAGR